MKKRKILIATVIVFTMGFLPACDLIEECGTCVLYTEDADGNIIQQGTPLPFCGDALSEKENQSPEEFNGITTYWVCD